MKDLITSLYVNVYWLSVPFVGFFILTIIQKYSKNHQIDMLIRRLWKQHVFVIFLVSFTVSVFLWSALSLVLYFLDGPVILLSILYAGLFISAAIYSSLHVSKRLFDKRPFDLFQLSGQPLLTKLLLCLFLVFIIADYLISIDIKSYALVSADTYVHLARIVSILSEGFTIHSGFFSTLPETGYHYNVIYALYAMGSQITRAQPFEVWQYSFGFFRLVQWLAVFTLGWYALKHWLKWEYIAYGGTILTVITAMAVYTPYFFTAVYPNQVVNIWLILLVLGISMYEQGEKTIGYCLVALSLVITMTHPTYALIATLFVGLVLLVRAILERKSFLEQKEKIKLYFLMMFVLLLGPLRTVTFPNRMNAQQADVGSFATLHVFGMSMKAPVDILPNNMTAAIITFFGLIGIMYLLVSLWSKKKQFAIVLSLALFYPLIVYFPPVFTIIHKILPLWVIDRFSAMNVLVYALILIGIYASLLIAGKMLMKIKQFTIPAFILRKETLYISTALIALVFSLHTMVYSYTQLEKSRAEDRHYYAFMSQSYADFKDVLKDEEVIIANQGDSYFLTSIFPIDVIAVEAGHMSPVASADNRIACQSHILQTFDRNDLKVVKAVHVVIAKYDKQYNDEKTLADSKPYLQYESQDSNFYAYKVIDMPSTPTDPTPYKACREYLRIERS